MNTEKNMLDISKRVAQNILGQLVPYVDQLLDINNKGLSEKLVEVTTQDTATHVYADDLAREGLTSWVRHSMATKMGNYLEGFLLRSYWEIVEAGLVPDNRFYKTRPGDFYLISQSAHHHLIELASGSTTKNGADRKLAEFLEKEYNNGRKAGVPKEHASPKVNFVFTIFDAKFIQRNPQQWGYGTLSQELYGNPDVLDAWHSEAHTVAKAVSAIRESRLEAFIQEKTRYLASLGMPLRSAFPAIDLRAVTRDLSDVIMLGDNTY